MADNNQEISSLSLTSISPEDAETIKEIISQEHYTKQFLDEGSDPGQPAPVNADTLESKTLLEIKNEIAGDRKVIKDMPQVTYLDLSDFIIVDNGHRTGIVPIQRFVTFIYNLMTHAEDSRF